MMRWLTVSIFMLVAVTTAKAGELKMQEKVNYGGWPNCVRLTNGQVELIVTTDVGPRIIRFGFAGGQNLFNETKGQMGKTGGSEWRGYGGHRLWHAPEAIPRTYFPDNSPVRHSWDGKTLKLTQPIETTTGIVKEMEVTLDPNDNQVTVLHRLINKNQWEVELAPWCLTVMAAGGRAIFPQEPYRSHDDYLLPVRSMVMWGYTDMKDPRWTWGAKYIQLRQDTSAKTAQKVGLMNTLGWAAYTLNGELFLKRFGFDPKVTYPDYGCNTETYTDPNILEVETLGALARIPPDGRAEHIERWFLYRVQVGDSEESIDQKVGPLVKQTDRYKL